jgi:hypothetical protein
VTQHSNSLPVPCGQQIDHTIQSMRRRSCCHSPPGPDLDRRRRLLLPSLLDGPRPGHPLLPVPYHPVPVVCGPRHHLRALDSRHTGGACWVSGKAGRSVKVVDGWWLVLTWCRQCCHSNLLPSCPCFRGHRLSSRFLVCTPPSSQWLPLPYVGRLKLAALW